MHTELFYSPVLSPPPVEYLTSGKPPVSKAGRQMVAVSIVLQKKRTYMGAHSCWGHYIKCEAGKICCNLGFGIETQYVCEFNISSKAVQTIASC